MKSDPVDELNATIFVRTIQRKRKKDNITPHSSEIRKPDKIPKSTAEFNSKIQSWTVQWVKNRRTRSKIISTGSRLRREKMWKEAVKEETRGDGSSTDTEIRSKKWGEGNIITKQRRKKNTSQPWNQKPKSSSQNPIFNPPSPREQRNKIQKHPLAPIQTESSREKL